jgi:hypothetical protein
MYTPANTAFALNVTNVALVCCCCISLSLSNTPTSYSISVIITPTGSSVLPPTCTRMSHEYTLAHTLESESICLNKSQIHQIDIHLFTRTYILANNRAHTHTYHVEGMIRESDESSSKSISVLQLCRHRLNITCLLSEKHNSHLIGEVNADAVACVVQQNERCCLPGGRPHTPRILTVQPRGGNCSCTQTSVKGTISVMCTACCTDTRHDEADTRTHAAVRQRMCVCRTSHMTW